MSDLLKSADEARKLLRGFRAFDEVATALELAGTATQAKAEAEAALAGLRAQIDAAKLDLDAANAGAESARLAAIKSTADAKTVADSIVSSAEARRASIVGEAQDEATRIRGENNATRDALALEIAQHDERLAALLAEVNDLEARADKARAYITKLAG